MIPGMSQLFLDDGERVSKIDTNTFEVVNTGAILRGV